MRLRVLIVEDSEDDALLIARTLHKGGHEIEHLRVATAPVMSEALRHGHWDLVISDHHMPGFSSEAALDLLKQRGLDLPFIIVSGQIGEEAAIAAMRAGAHDYIMKDKLGRLVPAVARELKEATIRRSQHEALERLAYLAMYDELTGLPNRNLLRDKAQQLSAGAGGCAVLQIGLDRFQTVNSSLSYALGNQALRALADRLRGLLCSGETLARLGGDIFAVLAPGLVEHVRATQRARELLEAFSMPLILDEGHTLYLTASMGIARCPEDDAAAEALLSAADQAMHRAKQQGGGHYRFFTPDMRADAAARLALEHDLRRALSSGALQLHYQPQIDCQTGRITGIEALLRWIDPQQGHVPNERIIPVLEETGLIVPVGDWVIREACRQSRRLQDQGHAPVSTAVNVSARQFERGDLLGSVQRALTESGLEPWQLELEITESLLLRNDADTLATLHALHERGVRIALDDFGTGYSSLGYLQRFPIDSLKIDRSFMRGLPDNPDNAAIAGAIIGMAHSLNMQVIAEGVESAAQQAFLCTRGCDQMQGYHLGRPMPAEQMERFWRSP